MTQPNPFGNTTQQGALQPQQPQQPVDEFELMRRRLRQRGAVAGGERQRELSRQFAALGNLPSGAAFDIRQRAAEAQQRATSEAQQDVNILQAQTQRQEREAAAQRGLQRELGQLQARTQMGLGELQAGTQRELGQLQARTQLEQVRQQTKSAFDIATLGARTDLEKLQLQGANQMQLAQLQADTALKERNLIEQGMGDRMAKQIAANQSLFDLEMEFKEKGFSLQQRIADQGITQAEAELQLNKAAQVINSLDPLMAMGFTKAEIGEIISVLEMPFAEGPDGKGGIRGILDKVWSAQMNQPPAPSKPTQEQKITETTENLGKAAADVGGEAIQDVVNAVMEPIEDWFQPSYDPIQIGSLGDIPGISTIVDDTGLGGLGGAVSDVTKRVGGTVSDIGKSIFG